LPHEHPSAGPEPAGRVDVEAIRRAWPDVVTHLSTVKKMTWTLVRDHAQVLGYDGRRLTLGLSTVGLTATFKAGAHGEFVRQALIDVLGVDAQVDGTYVDPSREKAFAQPSPPPAAMAHGPALNRAEFRRSGRRTCPARRRPDARAGQQLESGGASTGGCADCGVRANCG
jgi:DNA polymerase-3 subunit gamma/tau